MTTTACPICNATDIPAEGKAVHFCVVRHGRKVISREYIGYFDGRPLVYNSNGWTCETELDYAVSALLARTAWETADMEAEAAASAEAARIVPAAVPCRSCADPLPAGENGYCAACAESGEAGGSCGFHGPYYDAECPACAADKLTPREQLAINARMSRLESEGRLHAAFNVAYCLAHNIITPAQLAARRDPPTDDSGPEPWDAGCAVERPEPRCPLCGGWHHIQRCPLIWQALRAPVAPSALRYELLAA